MACLTSSRKLPHFYLSAEYENGIVLEGFFKIKGTGLQLMSENLASFYCISRAFQAAARGGRQKSYGCVDGSASS